VASGARVVVEPTLPCGQCKMCLTGRENVCADRGFFGCGHSQGGMADCMTIREDRLHVIPESLPIAAAALIEPIATPLHAITLSGGVEGIVVVVLCAGTIGLLTVIACRARDARTIAVTDLSDTKLDPARRLGANHAVSAAMPDCLRQVRSHLGESADIVVDCVAATSTVAAVITLVERGGAVTIVGVPSAPTRIDLPAIQEHPDQTAGRRHLCRD
jgi:threonine dehydrogenase-like Zn-dependent dehydrogenase